MLSRLRNLWNLNEFKPEHSDKILSRDDLILRRDIGRKPKGKAIIIEDEPEDMFPDHNDSFE